MEGRSRSVLAAGLCALVLVVATTAAVAVTNRATTGQEGQPTVSDGSNAATTRTPGDVDGDGRTDLIVYRPESASFWVEQSAEGQIRIKLGRTGDEPAVGDFDGDGRADLVAIDAGDEVEAGTWSIWRSSDATTTSEEFGRPGDVAVPADYDGDGRFDLAVFRGGRNNSPAVDASPQNTAWIVRSSRDGSVSTMEFGLVGDMAAPGDYDGDGLADVAVQRGGTRWIRYSSDGSTESISFGRAGDLPVTADRDGDGRTDLGVVRRVADGWRWFWRSNAGEEVIDFGLADQSPQLPLVGDFDGNGRSEPAVFDQPTSTFWIWDEDDAVSRPWGAEGDIVAPLGTYESEPDGGG